ncbi:hypothetical protein AAG570_005278 [Ranatra chinensis]|uniref:Uncharacterized protein n=1 Tax=Ranatra chinensis TaxID=642074 RepID=A0ABD0YCP3_9HEMI
MASTTGDGYGVRGGSQDVSSTSTESFETIASGFETFLKESFHHRQSPPNGHRVPPLPPPPMPPVHLLLPEGGTGSEEESSAWEGGAALDSAPSGPGEEPVVEDSTAVTILPKEENHHSGPQRPASPAGVPSSNHSEADTSYIITEDQDPSTVQDAALPTSSNPEQCTDKTHGDSPTESGKICLEMREIHDLAEVDNTQESEDRSDLTFETAAGEGPFLSQDKRGETEASEPEGAVPEGEEKSGSSDSTAEDRLIPCPDSTGHPPSVHKTENEESLTQVETIGEDPCSHSSLNDYDSRIRESDSSDPKDSTRPDEACRECEAEPTGDGLSSFVPATEAAESSAERENHLCSDLSLSDSNDASPLVTKRVEELEGESIDDREEDSIDAGAESDGQSPPAETVTRGDVTSPADPPGVDATPADGNLPEVAGGANDNCEPPSTCSLSPPVIEPTDLASPQLDSSSPLELASPQLDSSSPQELASPQRDSSSPQELASPQLDSSSPQELASPQLDSSSPEELASPQLDSSSPQELASPQLDNSSPQELASPQLDSSSPQELESPQLDNSSPTVLTCPQLDSSSPQELESPQLDNSSPAVLTCPQLDSSSPPDLASPQLDNSSPQELASPQFDSSSPADLANPQLDNSSPVDLASPQLDSSSPADLANPQLDSSSPPDLASPRLENSSPADLADPQLDSSSPQELASPQLDSSSPADLANPQLDNSSPVDLASPQLDSSSPADLANPQLDSSSPPDLASPQLENSSPADLADPQLDSSSPQELASPQLDSSSPQELESPQLDSSGPADLACPQLDSSSRADVVNSPHGSPSSAPNLVTNGESELTIDPTPDLSQSDSSLAELLAPKGECHSSEASVAENPNRCESLEFNAPAPHVDENESAVTKDNPIDDGGFENQTVSTNQCSDKCSDSSACNIELEKGDNVCENNAQSMISGSDISDISEYIPEPETSEKEEAAPEQCEPSDDGSPEYNAAEATNASVGEVEPEMSERTSAVENANRFVVADEEVEALLSKEEDAKPCLSEDTKLAANPFQGMVSRVDQVNNKEEEFTSIGSVQEGKIPEYTASEEESIVSSTSGSTIKECETTTLGSSGEQGPCVDSEVSNASSVTRTSEVTGSVNASEESQESSARTNSPDTTTLTKINDGNVGETADTSEVVTDAKQSGDIYSIAATDKISQGGRLSVEILRAAIESDTGEDPTTSDVEREIVRAREIVADTEKAGEPVSAAEILAATCANSGEEGKMMDPLCQNLRDECREIDSLLLLPAKALVRNSAAQESRVIEPPKVLKQDTVTRVMKKKKNNTTTGFLRKIARLANNERVVDDDDDDGDSSGDDALVVIEQPEEEIRTQELTQDVEIIRLPVKPNPEQPSEIKRILVDSMKDMKFQGQILKVPKFTASSSVQIDKPKPPPDLIRLDEGGASSVARRPTALVNPFPENLEGLSSAGKPTKWRQRPEKSIQVDLVASAGRFDTSAGDFVLNGSSSSWRNKNQPDSAHIAKQGTLI